MNILASAEIRLNYNSVVEKCKESGEPVYLTKNGQGELVVMDIESFERREQELRAQEMVLEAIASHLSGAKMYSNDEVFAEIEKIIKSK